ncbi:MAG: response regulator transcription factor [Tepidisphaeraceae bacterium]
MRVLLVDPDAVRALGVSEELRGQNLESGRAGGADDAVAALNEGGYRVVVLDDSVPGGALSLIGELRAQGEGLPIIVVTDNPEPSLKIALLDAGADDVLLRPYPVAVLPAQIRSLLRRCAPFEGAVLKFEDLSLDLRSLQVVRQGQIISATSRELAVLEYLLRNCERVVTRSELAEAIWNDEELPGSNVIEVFIARLRRKVDRPFETPLIHTIVGRGYMLSSSKPNASEEQKNGKPQIAE